MAAPVPRSRRGVSTQSLQQDVDVRLDQSIEVIGHAVELREARAPNHDEKNGRDEQARDMARRQRTKFLAGDAAFDNGGKKSQAAFDNLRTVEAREFGKVPGL